MIVQLHPFICVGCKQEIDLKDWGWCPRCSEAERAEVRRATLRVVR